MKPTKTKLTKAGLKEMVGAELDAVTANQKLAYEGVGADAWEALTSAFKGSERDEEDYEESPEEEERRLRAADLKAAKEILATRAGDYSSTRLPEGKRVKNKMKLSRARLRQIIKEELQKEGFLDFFKGKKKGPSKWWLHPEIPTDVKQFTRGGTPREYEAMVKQTIDFLDALDPEAMFFNPIRHKWDELQKVPESLDRYEIYSVEDLRNAGPNPIDLDRDRASWDIWSAEAHNMLGEQGHDLSEKVYEYVKSFGGYTKIAKEVQSYLNLQRVRRGKGGWIRLRQYFKHHRPEIERMKGGIETLLKGTAPQEVMEAFKLAVIRGQWQRIVGAGAGEVGRASMDDIYRTLLDLTDRDRQARMDDQHGVSRRDI